MNEFIYNEVSENVDRLKDMIKERVLTYTRMDEKLFNQLTVFLEVYFLNQAQKLTKSKDYDDSEMIENKLVRYGTRKALGIELDGENVILTDLYSVNVYKYVGAKDLQRKRDYEHSIYRLMQELFSLPLFLIALSYLNGANAEKKFVEIIKDFINRLKYIEGKSKTYKDDRAQFIIKMRLAYTELKNEEIKATKENMAKKMEIATSTYKDQIKDKYKLELNEQTGEIYDLTREGKPLI